MTDIRTLAPHDPLPDEHSVVLMRRFAEDAPDALVIEIIVTRRDGRQSTETPTGPDGAPLDWMASIGVAKARAEADGLGRIWMVDRSRGKLESEIVEHGGKRGLEGGPLDDDDLEDGERGPDMRDIDTGTAPRRF